MMIKRALKGQRRGIHTRSNGRAMEEITRMAGSQKGYRQWAAGKLAAQDKKTAQVVYCLAHCPI